MRKLLVKFSLGIRIRRFEDEIKTDLREIECENTR